jgi:alpha-beta hydrolase superfamily lysophospholipase
MWMIAENYWHTYYDAETIERSESLRQEFTFNTADARLHMDAYVRPDPSRPVVLLTHGEGGYSRLFVRPALALYDRGYSVLVLDQRGHGLSSGHGDDFTLVQLTQDVLDASYWARRNFSGPLFLAGANQGGALVYNASTIGAPVIGLICHHLYDYSPLADGLALSRFAGIADMPGGVQLANAAARTLMALSPRLRLPADRLTSFDGLLDERDNGNFEAWQEDPQPPRTVSLRYAYSTISSPPAVPYEDNALPVLVINPTRDRMVDPEITRRNFERLGGRKTYAEIDYGHWSLLEPFAREWSALLDE